MSNTRQDLEEMRKRAVSVPRAQTTTDLRRFRTTKDGTMESPIKPPFDQFGHLSIRECTGIKEKSPWGFEPFVIPKMSHPGRRVCSFAPTRSKNIPMHDIVQKEKRWVPGPIYIPHSDWRQQFKLRGKWGKYKKISFTESVFNSEKDKVPPSKYDVFHSKKNKPLGAIKLTDTDINFTDEAKWYAMQTPSAKYDRNYSLTCPRMITNVNMARKCYSVSDNPTSWRIPKMDGVGPGSYNYPISFDKTQKPRLIGDAAQKSLRKDFTDVYKAVYKFIPPMGTYKEIDKGIKLQTKPRQQQIHRQ